MRFGSVCLLALGGVLGAVPALAGEPSASPTSPAVSADATEAARAHFKTGVRLYQEANYGGALAEFDAAYQLKPGPGSLQNVALCQKALLRYGEAVDTLTLLLTRHDAELSDAERTAAKRAKDELDALVGSVALAVSPANADVTLDGQPLALVDRERPLRLNVGEHTLGATAPGYARASTTVRVVGGQHNVPVELTLAPTAGFIDVRSADPEAAISIDGKPIAFGHVVLPVTAATEHLVQIYKQGVAPFEARVTVELGKTALVSGQPGATGTAAAAATPATPGAANVPSKPAVGWYGVGSVSLLATGATPFRFDLTQAKQGAWGLGLRVGRRLRPAVAVEGLLEYDVLKVRGACDEEATQNAIQQLTCNDDARITVNYLVRSLRFGPTLELMTTDPRFRGLGGLGLGLVWHELRVGLDQGQSTNPYLLLEGGIGANTNHVLLAFTAQIMLDWARGLGHRPDEAAFDKSGRILPFVGLNLRVGYSQWAP